MYGLVVLLLLATGAGACMRRRAFVRLGCPRDVHRTATRRTTSAVVSWARPDFSLQSSHDIKGIYQTVPIYGASSTVNRHFDEGIHYVEYKAVDESGNFDSCSFSVSVSVIRCSPLYNPQFGIVTCDAANVYGSTCTFVCIPGYATVGSAGLQCQLDGRWSHDVPFCRTTTCPEPGTPLGGHRLCTTPTHAYGSICKFDCDNEYHLVGHERIICKSDGNRTYWSGRTPVCDELVPPTVEQCPGAVQLTTSEPTADVQRPSVVFRTAAGLAPAVTCTYFGAGDKHRFALGRHRVSCTAFDPDFGERASATCTFVIDVKANPCRALQRPLHGSMLCLRTHGGGSSRHETTCRIFCDTGYALARDRPDATLYECDATGTWQPSARVPSCVTTRRPRELRLPSEIFFRSSDCRDGRLLSRLRVMFESTLQTLVRQQEACAVSPGDCIVEDVLPTCQLGRQVARRRRYLRTRWRRARRRDVGAAGGQRRDVTARERDVTARGARRRRRRRRRHGNRRRRARHHGRRRAGDGDVTRRKRHGGARRGGGGRDRRTAAGDATGRQFLLAVQFNFSTRVPEAGGSWPDQYHKALYRLLGMFDHFDERLAATTFKLNERVDGLNFSEVKDSLTHMRHHSFCDIGYKFFGSIQLCVPCGAGTHYDLRADRCALCPIGEYQNDEAKYNCTRCPPGSTTVGVGAINRTQCVDIDECESSPCLNYGECENGFLSYTCSCQAGFAGDHCELKVYDCRVHACQNEAECVPEGEHNYTCACKPGYSEEYCQYQQIDGRWRVWSEWSECSESCAGGVTRRRRQCDSPAPSHGGRACAGRSHAERRCNVHVCPECTPLRRPYGGTIRCKRTLHPDMTYCKANCPAGFVFATATTVDEYACGSNTSYRWPHESPDNPRCVLPACTRVAQPVETNYRFRSSLPLACVSDAARVQLAAEIGKRAAEMTSSLACVQSGACHLATPTVSGCPESGRRRRRATGDGASTVGFEVVIVYPHPPATPASHSDIARLGTALLSAAASGDMYLVVDGVTVTVRANDSSAVNTVVCIAGSVPAPVGEYCVECSPGSFHNPASAACVLCAEGSYQPAAASGRCRACPGGQLTYGRGAVYAIECYENGTTPPIIPEDYKDDYGVATGSLAAGAIVAIVIGCTVALAIALGTVFIFRRSYAAYDVVASSAAPTAAAAPAVTKATATPTEMATLGPEAVPVNNENQSNPSI